MSFSVVTVKFSNEKTCFVSLSTGIFKANDKTDIQVFEVEDYNGGNKCYVSWSGEVIRSEPGSDGAMLINGMYGAKLGLKDNEQIILRPCTSVKKCLRVSVEPLSVDDWEILDRHTGFFESHVMDQIRVVQKGRVFPVWVEKSICVYINVVSTSPDTECVLLVNETEVLVAPKVRNSAIGQPVSEEPIRKAITNDLNVPFLSNAATQSSEDETFDTKFNSTDSDYSLKDIRYLDSSRDDRNRREKSPYDFSNISSQWQGLFSLLGFGRTRLESKVDVSDGEDDYFDDDEEDSFHQSKNLLQNGLNLILRVQYLKHTIRDGDHNYTEPVCRRGSNHSRKGGSSSPRKGSRESPSKPVRNQSNPKSNFRINYFPQQPSTIYIDKFDACRQLKCNRKDVPPVFFAKLRKLASPREQQQEKLNQSTQSAKLGQSLGSSSGSSSGKGSPRKTTGSKDKPSPDLSDSQKSDSNLSIDNDNSGSCFVRVIVLDRRRHLCNDHYRDVMKRVLDEQPLLSGHVIVPDMLRRYLKLDISSRLWLQTYKATPSRTMAFSLHPLGNAPKVTHDMMCLAFRQWLDQISSEEYPLVVYQGLFLRFPTSPDQFVECQLTYNEPNTGNKCCHTLLHPGTLRSASLSVISQNRSTDLTHPAIQPMLAYNSLTSFDPVVPKVDFKMIGGMSDLLEKILCNVEICLGSRPLYKEVFLTTPGLLNGMLLLTGPKGSGKTTLAKAVCRKVSELPNLAYTIIVECKPLRGKKVDTLQKILELLFDEAAWHQPSLIVLEDLDHIAGAPAGPEFEMSGEALYAARVAEVVKDLLRKDIRNMSNLAVIATSQSRSSLHSILVSSRGTHLVQEVITINPPDRDQRKEIITTLLETKTTISQSALSSLDVDKLAQQTQGYVARDLESIINRAVHAHILTQGRAIQSESELDLCENDFLVALNGFTPASIRNVPLHEAGGLGWQDIGGLTEVKETLVETLQWPSKYPTLFANCPLRLRSGLLLYGAPGTGKTLLAGVVAKECGLNFISIKGPELLSKYIGASEQAVRETFVRAQSAKPCILFFDEFDSIAPRRGHDNTGVTDRVVNQLLTQLDGVEGLEGVYVLAATSRPDLIDPALLRPGRLDKSLLCTMPNEDDRLKILKALSRKMYLSSDVDFQHFARVCQDYTGADFKALLYNAQLEAIHEFTSQDSTTSEGDVGKFGMKARRGRYNKLKTPSKTKLLRVDSDGKTERRQSFSSGTHAFIPSLEEGVVQVSAEMEERLNTQISQIRLRDRRQSEHIAAEELPESPYGTSKLLLVNQSHMMAAANKMRPSVAGEERQKYERIYENFVSSRGGTFHTGFMEAQELMKATLA